MGRRKDGGTDKQPSVAGTDERHINTAPQSPSGAEAAEAVESDGEDELGDDDELDEDALAGGSVRCC
jgi:hypothetical protein